MNNFQAIGRLTQQPELRYSNNGTAICELRVAVNYDRDTVDFFTVTAFGKGAENAAEYLVVGQRIGITGHLKQHQWKTADNEPRSRIEMIADRLDYLDAPRNDGNQQQAPTAATA